MNNSQTLSSAKLYLVAKDHLGMRMPAADPELNCVGALAFVFRKCFGVKLCDTLSTATLFEILQAHPDFVEVEEKECAAGDIIISPTGWGSGKIPHGHTGIIAMHGIMSNDSESGFWREKWELGTWKEYYGTQGRYPVKFYRVQDTINKPAPVPPAQLSILSKIVALFAAIISKMTGK